MLQKQQWRTGKAGGIASPFDFSYSISLEYPVQFLAEYGIFLAKTVTLIGGLVFLIVTVVGAGQRFKKLEKQGHIEVTSLNDKYRDMADALQASVLSEAEYSAYCKAEKKAQKAKDKQQKQQLKSGAEPGAESRVFVVDFVGDIRASACEALAEQVTAILTQANERDEVVVRLESSGGMVHSYGLAASQLQRIRDRAIPLTVCVDKVAASGGYMMACIANRLLAAPFAILGSIGVVAQLPNVHRLLKKHDVDYEMLTAGEYKRTLTVFGENTDKARQKFQQEIDETHDLFKSFVGEHRPQLDMASVATGEVWFGRQALGKGLIDGIQTSDDYLFTRHKEAALYRVEWVEKHSIGERLGLAAEAVSERVLLRWLDKLGDRSTFFR